MRSNQPSLALHGIPVIYCCLFSKPHPKLSAIKQHPFYQRSPLRDFEGAGRSRKGSERKGEPALKGKCSLRNGLALSSPAAQTPAAASTNWSGRPSSDPMADCCTPRKKLCWCVLLFFLVAGITGGAIGIYKWHYSGLNRWHGAGSTADFQKIIQERCDTYTQTVRPGSR